MELTCRWRGRSLVVTTTTAGKKGAQEEALQGHGHGGGIELRDQPED